MEQIAPPPVATIEATIDSVMRKDQASDTIAELRELYKSQVEVYRFSEQQFYIAKEQHSRLQTLASLEEAVRATREVFLNRSRVLVTYVQLIRTTLTDIPGVELSLKQRALARLDSLEKKLLVHQDAILNTNSRTEVAARADEFEEMQDELKATIYLTLTLISHGRVQTIYDQAVIVHRDITTYHQNNPGSALVDAARERAHTETTRNFEGINSELQAISLSVADQAEKIESYNKTNHERALEELESPHVQLTQLVGYLAELLRL